MAVKAERHCNGHRKEVQAVHFLQKCRLHNSTCVIHASMLVYSEVSLIFSLVKHVILGIFPYLNQVSKDIECHMHLEENL